MIEMLTKLVEEPQDRRGFKKLAKLIRALASGTGIDFYPCMYGGRKDGKMCAVVGAKSASGSGATLCLAAFPGSRTLLCVRGASATRQLEAESPAADAPGVGALLESVFGSLDEIAGRIGDELTLWACGLEWRLTPVAPPKEEEGDGGPRAGGGKSGVDPAMEVRIRKALAEQLARDRGGAEQPRSARPAAELVRELAEAASAASGVPPIRLDSGLVYLDLAEGEGDPPPPGATVRVHYTGCLADGTQFDSSHARGEPAEFPLGAVIRGWAEGVGSMRPGGKRRLIIPPDLGYGESGSPPAVPPNAVLDFVVELLAITPARS